MKARELYDRALGAIGTDKGLHYLCGFVWAAHAALLGVASQLDPIGVFWASFLSAAFVAVLKEVVDDLANKNASTDGEPQFHTSDMKDAAATVLGGLHASALVSLAFWSVIR